MSNEQVRTFVLTMRADMSEPDVRDALRDLRAMWGVASIEPLRQPPARETIVKKPSTTAPSMKGVANGER